MSERDGYFQRRFDEIKDKRAELGEVSYKNHLEQVKHDAEEAAADIRELASRGGAEISPESLARIAAITAVVEAIAEEVLTLG